MLASADWSRNSFGGNTVYQHLPLAVLLADDRSEEAVRTRIMLFNADCDVRVVHDGVAAVAAASTGEFDLIFMAIEHHVFDGMDATMTIRALETARQCRRTRIIGIVDVASLQNRARLTTCGMDAVLARPVSVRDLQRVLRQHRLSASSLPLPSHSWITE